MSACRCFPLDPLDTVRSSTLAIKSSAVCNKPSQLVRISTSVPDHTFHGQVVASWSPTCKEEEAGEGFFGAASCVGSGIASQGLQGPQGVKYQYDEDSGFLYRKL